MKDRAHESRMESAVEEGGKRLFQPGAAPADSGASGRRCRPNLEDPARAEKGNVERLEEVELPENKRNLIRGRPGQDETDGGKLPDQCLDRAAGLDLRQHARKADLQRLGIIVDPENWTTG